MALTDPTSTFLLPTWNWQEELKVAAGRELMDSKTSADRASSPSGKRVTISPSRRRKRDQEPLDQRVIVFLLIGVGLMSLVVLGELVHDSWLVHTAVSSLTFEFGMLMDAWLPTGRKSVTVQRRKKTP